MIFEKIEDRTVCWQDFSNVTKLEKVVADVGNTLKSWDLKSGKLLEHEFALGESIYHIQFVPSRISNPRIPVIPDSMIDQIRALFGIDSGFFLVFTDEIPMEIARDFLSVCSTAFDSFLGDTPFLMRLSIPEFLTFLGRRNLGNGYSVFSSRLDTEVPECFESFQGIVDVFKSTYHVVEKDIDFSARLLFTLDNGQLICYEWERQRVAELRKVALDFREAKNCLLLFNVPESQGIDDIAVAVECVSKCGRQWKPRKTPYKEMKWLKKAAPKKSILDIAVCPAKSLLSLMARKMTQGRFDDTWRNFRKWIRHMFDKRKQISSVQTLDSTSSECLLYQKLQMLSYGIGKIRMGDLRTSNYFVTSDMLEEIDRIIKASTKDEQQYRDVSKLVDAALSIKARNPGVPFAEFQQELRADELSAKILWDAISPSLFDYVQQCEMAIDYIDGLTPRELIPLLCYILCCEVLGELKEHIDNSNEEFVSQLEAICAKLKAIDLQTMELSELAISFGIINTMIGQLQMNYNHRCDLLGRFPGCEKLVDQLVLTGSYTVSEPSDRRAVDKYLLEDEHISTEIVQQSVQVIMSSHRGDDNSVVHGRLYVSTDRATCLVASTTTELFK